MALALYVGIFLISAAMLSFEIILTRVFAVTQWYHFAFLSVSVALLGFGASGTWLALNPLPDNRRLRACLAEEERTRVLLSRLADIAALFSIGILIAYLAINYVPFDSYRLAWERRQLLYLAVYYASLIVPFFFAGLGVGLPLAAWPRRASILYAANLTGSAVGSVAVLALMPALGGAGAVVGTSALSMIAAAVLSAGALQGKPLCPLRGSGVCSSLRNRFLLAMVGCLLLFTLSFRAPGLFDLRLSPYKALSSSLLFPNAKVVFSRWNAFSRVDVVDSAGIHSAPGLSLAYTGPLPEQLGVMVDGANLSPITCINDPEEARFLGYLPTALPYVLRPRARVLVIEPRGGLDIETALHHGASSVVALESNPLVVKAVRESGSACGQTIYDDPRVSLVAEAARSYLRRSQEDFDVVLLSLSDTYQPVMSGAYSLVESYLYTVEAFGDYLSHLRDDGLLVITRWVQSPPSEELRACVLLAEALKRIGQAAPSGHVVALRSWSTATLLAKRTPFRSEEVALLKGFCRERSFDLIYYSGMAAEESNRYNVLPESWHFQAFHEVLSTDARPDFVETYPYEISAPTDDRPFFFHFFRWGQTQAIVKSLGKIWQPFGGSGFLILVALLALSLILSLILILLPLLMRGSQSLQLTGAHSLRTAICFLLYFACLGLGFLFVEMPLLQQFILFLGQPSYSFSLVLFSILLFSGVGSALSGRMPLPHALPMLAGTTLAYPWLFEKLFAMAIGWPLPMRLALAVMSLAPLGLLLGQPLPSGIRLLEERAPHWIPWAWAVNGCASVVSSVLAVIGAVNWGFSRVLQAGAASYLMAWAVVAFLLSRPARVQCA